MKITTAYSITKFVLKDTYFTFIIESAVITILNTFYNALIL